MPQIIKLSVPSDFSSTPTINDVNTNCIFSGVDTIMGTDPGNGENDASNTVTDIHIGSMVKWIGECSNPNPNDVTVDIMYINHSADSLF